MALATATITYNLANLVGTPHHQGTSVTATTTIPGNTIADTDGNKIRLGSGAGTVTTSGDGEIAVWVPGAGSNPESWQTYIHVKHRDPSVHGGNTTRTFGPFTITASANLADLIAEMPVQPEYAAAIIDEISGYTDHGNVSGAVTFDAPTGTHVFDATAPTTITLDGYTNGQSVALVCFTGASDVTVTDAGDLELADGLATGMLRARDTWITGGGGGVPVSDTTPPTAVTDLTATGGAEQIVLAWSASTDAESTVSYGWKVWLVGDAEPSTYTVRSTPGVTVTGLAPGNYNAKVYAYSSGGSTLADTATATVTAPAYTPPAVESLEGWWDAADDSTFTFSSGTVVSQWRDKSGNARHFAQADSSKRPSRSGTENGLPTVAFDGINDRMTTSAFALPQPFTLIVATRSSGAMVSGNGENMQVHWEGNSYVYWAGGGFIYTDLGASPTAAGHVYSFAFNGASSATWRDGTAGGVGNPGATNLTAGLAFGDASGGTFLNGEVMEVLAYSGILSTANRNEVEDYLQIKWGTA